MCILEAKIRIVWNFFSVRPKSKSGNKKSKVLRKNPWVKRASNCRHQFYEGIVWGYKRSYKFKKKIPSKFNYSIVVPIRNGVFLSIATAWAFSLNASLVAYGAHTGDKNYPDCRPAFSKKIESAFNQGETDGIRSGIRKRIAIWSPYKAKLSKKQLLKKGYDVLGDKIFNTWSCYKNGKVQCGKCESCNNRKAAFLEAGIEDKTSYLQ